MGDWASLADRVLRLKEFCAGIHAARSKTFFPKADSERSWDALTKRRGVTLRELVPKPVPDEMMEVMDNASGTLMGGTPHLPGTREFFTVDPFAVAGGVSVVVLAKVGV